MERLHRKCSAGPASNGAYGQYGDFARALDLIGRRWALLIVRDLLIEPKRFGDLKRALHGIPSNILAARLEELGEAGVVRRCMQKPPARGIAYELTSTGLALEDTVLALAKWGRGYSRST